MCLTHQMDANFCLVAPSISKDVEEQELHTLLVGGRKRFCNSEGRMCTLYN